MSASSKLSGSRRGTAAATPHFYGGNAGEHDAVESSGDSLARADEIAALESARKVVEVVDGVAFAGKLAHLTAHPTDNPQLLRAMQ